MNLSASSFMAPKTNDYHVQSSSLRSKILKNEEQRIQLEQKLRAIQNRSSRPYQQTQIQYIQNYFTRLNQDAQRAEQRNLQILNELTEAQDKLERLHDNAKHLTKLKDDYLRYLHSNYPNWQRPIPTQIDMNQYDRLSQHMQQQQHLQSVGNLRQSVFVPSVQQSYDADSSMLFKRYENQLQVGMEGSSSPQTPILNNNERNDEQSISESNDSMNLLMYQKRSNGSLRIDLTRAGLFLLLDYIEEEFKNEIDKKKFYDVDTPTVSQKRTIVNLANEKNFRALKEHDPTTISMVIHEQLAQTIRHTTVNKCLLTEEILSSNIKDLNKSRIAQILPEQDHQLWLRLVSHFAQLVKLHIMDIQTLINKFTVSLLPTNSQYALDKAKSLLHHVLQNLVRIQSADSDSDNSDDESFSKKQQPTKNKIQTTNKSSSSWLNKVRDGSALDEDD